MLHGLYAWQIYAGPTWEATARWTYDRWMHVKLVVSGTRAELYVDGDSAVQVIPRLHGPEGAGEVGVIVGPGAARFANFVVRPADAPSLAGTPPAVPDSTPAGIVRTWRVSTPFAESLITGVADLAAVPGPAIWDTLGIEERGIANLARLAGNGNGRNTVVAAVTITSDRARTVPVRFGGIVDLDEPPNSGPLDRLSVQVLLDVDAEHELGNAGGDRFGRRIGPAEVNEQPDRRQCRDERRRRRFDLCAVPCESRRRLGR